MSRLLTTLLVVLTACTREPRQTNAVSTNHAALGVEATPAQQAWFPAQDLPVQQYGGTVVARGGAFTAFWPRLYPASSGFFFTTLGADGGLAPVGFATPNAFGSFGSSQLFVTPVDDTRSVLAAQTGDDVGLGLVDSQGLIVYEQWLHCASFRHIDALSTPGLVRLPHRWA